MSTELVRQRKVLPVLTVLLSVLIALAGVTASSVLRESTSDPVLPAAAGDDLGDGTRLAQYEVVGGVKVFRLRAAPLSWEVSPGNVRQAFAYNGTVPGPVIRVNEGDTVRFIVQNDLPESTSLHWHGMDLPNDQDGVPGLTQPEIEPGQSFTYEWKAISTGTH